MVPPGIPDFHTRKRHVRPGPCTLAGRAWSGLAPIVRVEMSSDGGATWQDSELADPGSPYAWRGWTYVWQAEPGEHELCCRATDASGKTQPTDPAWNLGGYCNNAVQRVAVVVADR
jgi:sulfane dehydrogenase subunit SoxC